MYSKISNPIIDVYDSETGVFFGEARFELSAEAEKELLQLVNDNKVPSSLVLLNVTFYQQVSQYEPPSTYEPVRRKGILRALFTDSVTGEQTPLEIRFQYDARTRGSHYGDEYFFDSVEYSNLEVDSIQVLIY